MFAKNPFKTDQKLHKALLNGNNRAWQYFINHYTPLMLSTVKPILGEYGQESADIVQEIFGKLCEDQFRLLKSYQTDRASLATWLVVICKSRSIDWIRKKRLVTVNVEELPDLPIEDDIDDEQKLDYPKALLSDREKTVMALFFDEERDVDEIATLLDIEAQTVRSLRHKAIVKLRKYYQNQD